jgi:hypothetical protein
MVTMASAGQAQDQDPPQIQLEDFRLDAPPALSLIGSSSSSVSRPNTPRALITSLVSATGSSGLVPNGYAMETAPFWLASHPLLTIPDYYRASLSERLKYFTAFSVATSRHSARNDSVNPDARVAIAVRTLLLNGRPSVALVATMDSMRKAQLSYITKFRRAETLRASATGLAAQRRKLAREEELLSSLTTKVLVRPDDALRDSALRTLARRDSARSAVAAAESADDELARVEKQMTDIEGDLADLGESFAERDLEPDGLVLEVAAGTRALFAEGQWSRERVDGFGVWATPMYRLPSQRLEIIGVARYLTRVAEYDDENLLDLGGRLGWDLGRANLSAEWVNRSVRKSGIGNTSSWAALFNYPLPAKLQLVASFGSDFRRLDGKRPVIATLGINLGLGAVMITPSGKNTGR